MINFDAGKAPNYRVEQFNAGRWDRVDGLETNIGWQAIDNCTAAFKASVYLTRGKATRVVEQATGLIPYFLTEQGQRDYSQEKH